MNYSKKMKLCAVAVCVAMMAGAVGAVPKQAPGRTDTITINLQDVDIESAMRTLADVTNRNIVVDPRVKGKLTLVTEQPVSRSAALDQFVSLLRMQGFTLVETAGLYKVVPEAEGKMQSAAVLSPDEANNGPQGAQIATQIFTLMHESANNLVPVLRPLISPNNTINANPGNNTLVITDYGDNLRRIARIIAALDVANATDVEIVSLKHAIAVDLAPLVLRLTPNTTATPSAPGAPAGAVSSTSVVAEPRTNSLIVRAPNRTQLGIVLGLIEKLDQPSASGSDGTGNIHVVYLKNADATKLAVTLRASIGAGNSQQAQSATPSTSATTSTGAVGASAVTSSSSTGAQVQADAATNSLIITAPEPQYRQLRAVIENLDARRAQVYVESLIAEVSSDKAAEFGIQWQGALGSAGSGVVGLLGTNFGTGGSNIINLAKGLGSGATSPSTGMNIGLAQRTNGVYVLGFLARMIEETGSGNVLSTPNILTLDNEEAKIVVGQNVPFVTGQYTNTSNSSTVSPFTTIERKDVGLTLKVKPQISENGTVKMAIYQEVSSVVASTVESANGPTTNKRTIESNVLVDDGKIIVLGGLLQDEYSGTEDKVPGLGNVPLFGHLFKSESRSRKKTNLMVFLRPVVVRDGRATDALSADRYELMRAGMDNAQPVQSSLVPVNEAPVLPALTKPSK